MTENCRLRGLGVLVTRPAHQAEPFCRLVEAAGGRAVRFPVIEIAPPQDPEKLQRQIRRLDDFDLAIFISPNAAERAVAAIMAERDFPAGLQRAAIGRKTARRLEALGYPAQIVPDKGFDSEALLALPEMQTVAGKNIIIFRGGPGRGLLADTLRARGAQVEYADVYRRIMPKPARPLASLLGDVDVVAVTSNEGLQNLFDMVDTVAHEKLRQKPLLAGSRRVVELAAKLGWNKIIIPAKNPGDDAMLDALCQWLASGDKKRVRKHQD